MSVTVAAPAQLRRPGGRGGLAAALRRRHLLALLVRKELRVRYRASVLGLGWSYVKPAVQFLVYYLAVGILLGQQSIGNYAVYLFGGLVVVTTFSEVVGTGTRSVVANAELVRKIYLPRELFPLSSLCVAVVHLVPQLAVLGMGALAAGWRPDPVGVACLLGALLLMLVFGLGCALLLSALNVVFRDIENVVDLVLMVLVWLSPVLYTLDRVRDALGARPWAMHLYEANPLTVAVELMHRGTWATTSAGDPAFLGPGFTGHALAATGLAIASVLLGQVVFSALTWRFAQEL